MYKNELIFKLIRMNLNAFMGKNNMRNTVFHVVFLTNSHENVSIHINNNMKFALDTTTVTDQ